MKKRAKFVFLGDTQVGKTSLIIRHRENEFDFNIITTVGNMVYDTIININGQELNLQINDTAG